LQASLPQPQQNLNSKEAAKQLQKDWGLLFKITAKRIVRRQEQCQTMEIELLGKRSQVQQQLKIAEEKMQVKQTSAYQGKIYKVTQKQSNHSSAVTISLDTSHRDNRPPSALEQFNQLQKNAWSGDSANLQQTQEIIEEPAKKASPLNYPKGWKQIGHRLQYRPAAHAPKAKAEDVYTDMKKAVDIYLPQYHKQESFLINGQDEALKRQAAIEVEAHGYKAYMDTPEQPFKPTKEEQQTIQQRQQELQAQSSHGPKKPPSHLRNKSFKSFGSS
jgi:hypothetical protein